MKIGIFEISGWKREYLKKNLKRHKLIFINNELNLNNLYKVKNVDGIVIFIYSNVNKEILNNLPKLKFIATMSTGVDHIDINFCRERKIMVFNVPSYGENTVAEHTFGLILSLSKKIPQSVFRTKSDNFSLKGLEGFDLKNKVLGVVGVGNIGQHVIKIANGFGMKVIANSKSVDKKLAKKLSFKFVSFDYLLKNSDIITLHLPLTAQTKHIINMDNIKLIKKGTYIINTARGGLIDTKALIYGLNNGIISGAGLDVLENEDDLKEEAQMLRDKFISTENMKTFLRNHRLLKEKNVIITPHSAFYTREAEIRILDTIISNIKSKKLNLTV
ncbi:MAG: NAD(P)-dependent oxidoreductase [Candidatus Pacearchaeota archaeon]